VTTSNPAPAAASNRVLLIIGLMLAMSVAALDGTVVSTALPTIVGSLGGLSLFSWVFSIYLLTSTVPVPLYGKLADLYGRKPVLLFGCALFMVGSLLCGIAGSMEQLIIFRAVQGLGAGAILPVVMTVIGDNFPMEQRARIQGFFSGVWGVSSLLGPVVGGLITEGVSWRWIFLINIPIGLVGIAILASVFHERLEKRSHIIDTWGTLLLTGALVCFLLALLQGVKEWGWLGGPTLVLFGAAAAQLVLFILQEQRVVEPLIALSLFKNKVIAVASLGTFMGGAMMFGFTSYVPLFIQGVKGDTALQSGLILLPMSFLWTVGSVISGRTLLRVGYYPSLIIGGVLLVSGAITLVFLNRDASLVVAALAGTFAGLGMGFTMPALVISVQNSVEWNQRGVATALTQFFRTIGGSISVAIMGAILASQVSHGLRDVEGVPPNFSGDQLLNVEQRSLLDPGVLDATREILASALHDIYFLVLFCACIAFAVVLFFPRGRVHELAVGAPQRTPAPSQRSESPSGEAEPAPGGSG
jgi:EmrB/QacA subfamily drug resistance transporter